MGHAERVSETAALVAGSVNAAGIGQSRALCREGRTRFRFGLYSFKIFYCLFR